MWNYRAVRRKRLWNDPEDQRERVDYSYAIHEAFYDNNGHVGAITQEPVAVVGEDIESLRHTWVMMVEAFGKPILDYDLIPEPGYERKEDPLGSMLDARQKTRKEDLIPWEDVKKDMEAKWGPFDSKAYAEEQETERLKKERLHESRFIGGALIDGKYPVQDCSIQLIETNFTGVGRLIDLIRSDYLEWLASEKKIK